MRAWVVDHPGPIATGPLRAVERPEPEPGPGEVRVRVAACGVCRTDLHLAEGDLPPRRPATVPGHEVVGVGRRPRPGRDPLRARRPDRHRVAARHLRALPVVPHAAGRTCARTPGSPAGTPTAATRSTRWSPRRSPTGCPTALGDGEAAPLLCAGIVGYRALRRAELPPGGRLGHLRVRRVRARRGAGRARPGGDGARADPLGAGPRARAAARRGLGRAGRRRAARAARRRDPVRAGGGAGARSRCGRSTRAARSPSPASTSPTSPALNYADELFREKQLRSVTANTRADGEEFLRLAAALARPADDRPPAARRGGPRPGRPGRGQDHRRRRPDGLITCGDPTGRLPARSAGWTRRGRIDHGPTARDRVREPAAPPTRPGRRRDGPGVPGRTSRAGPCGSSSRRPVVGGSCGRECREPAGAPSSRPPTDRRPPRRTPASGGPARTDGATATAPAPRGGRARTRRHPGGTAGGSSPWLPPACRTTRWLAWRCASAKAAVTARAPADEVLQAEHDRPAVGGHETVPAADDGHRAGRELADLQRGGMQQHVVEPAPPVMPTTSNCAPAPASARDRGIGPLSRSVTAGRPGAARPATVCATVRIEPAWRSQVASPSA